MTEAKTQDVPWSTLTQGGHLSRVLLLCFGVWLYAADSTLVATVMPVAVGEIGGLPYLSWTYSLYQLGSVVTGAIAGLMVLRTGIAQAQILAGIIYVLGCALSGYAPDMPTMIVGRLLQGMGGGGLVSIAFIGASTLFPKKLWVRIIAVISGVWGGVFLVRPVDRWVFCIRGKLARSVLGVCGAGPSSSVGGPTAFKKAVSNTKGTDTEDALGTALPFKRRGAGNLSSRGDDFHRGRKRLMCRRCPSAAGFSQAGCGQREQYFSARCPQPPDGLRIRPGDDVVTLHGYYRTDGLWPPPHVYYFWGRAFGSWLYHCLGVTGLDSRGDQHVRSQCAR